MMCARRTPPRLSPPIDDVRQVLVDVLSAFFLVQTYVWHKAEAAGMASSGVRIRASVPQGCRRHRGREPGACSLARRSVARAARSKTVSALYIYNKRYRFAVSLTFLKRLPFSLFFFAFSFEKIWREPIKALPLHSLLRNTTSRKHSRKSSLIRFT